MFVTSILWRPSCSIWETGSAILELFCWRMRWAVVDVVLARARVQALGQWLYMPLMLSPPGNNFIYYYHVPPPAVGGEVAAAPTVF